MCAVTSRSHTEREKEKEGGPDCSEPSVGAAEGGGLRSPSWGGRILHPPITVGEKLGPRLPVHPQERSAGIIAPCLGNWGAPGSSAARCEAGGGPRGQR